MAIMFGASYDCLWGWGFQVDLLLSFCAEMGFSSVILVGHDDGGLLALKAAQRVHASPNSVNVSNFWF